MTQVMPHSMVRIPGNTRGRGRARIRRLTPGMMGRPAMAVLADIPATPISGMVDRHKGTQEIWDSRSVARKGLVGSPARMASIDRKNCMAALVGVRLLLGMLAISAIPRRWGAQAEPAPPVRWTRAMVARASILAGLGFQAICRRMTPPAPRRRTGAKTSRHTLARTSGRTSAVTAGGRPHPGLRPPLSHRRGDCGANKTPLWQWSIPHAALPSPCGRGAGGEDSSARWESAIRARLRRRCGGWMLCHQAQRLGNSSFQLWVLPCHKGLGRIVHLYRRVRAVVLYAPADISEPEAKLRLRGDGPVHQRDQRIVVADHAAPGAFAHQRAEVEHLEGMAEYVAVGAGILIGQRHQRAARRLNEVWFRLAPPLEAIAEPWPHQRLQEEI